MGGRRIFDNENRGVSSRVVNGRDIDVVERDEEAKSSCLLDDGAMSVSRGMTASTHHPDYLRYGLRSVPTRYVPSLSRWDPGVSRI